ncbi:APC family permease [Pseudomonas cavernicola]|uniref:APC family permease n=1 Tax=Pseudomonas cavernicola TaxID=2320866 RepID=A0A418X968_9PSED|nr:APC family permease [Pseudomonas cavernicola]RJG09029.1 APC family permease [Pseudomonas cavernicola]
MSNTSTLSASESKVSGKSKLRGSLGVSSIVLMVVATAAPLTVMVANTPLIISMGNGAAAPFDALVATAIMLLFTIGFVSMSSHITNAGAFYAYIQKGMGRIVGLGSATLALLSYFLILVAIEAYMGFAIGELVKNQTGISIPWQAISVAVVVIVGILGYRDIELSSKFLGLALILEILIVLAVNALIFFDHGVAGMDVTPFTLPVITSGSPGLGIMFAIYCFIGFEATVVYREEARDPERTIPRATYAAVLIVGAFYVLSMWFEVIGFGVDNVAKVAAEHPADLYLILTQQYLGKVGYDVIQVLLVTSLFACVLSVHNIVVRYQYVLGRFGVFHKCLSIVHEEHGSPHVSSIVQTITSLALLFVLFVIGLDPVTQIYAWGATAGTLGYMAILSLTCASVIAFFWGSKSARMWNTKIAPLGGLVGLLFCLWIAISNLPSLIGGDAASAIAIYISAVMSIAFLVGIVVAMTMKTKFPSRYEKLRELA